ncbi:MAG: hypothetical protein AAF362_06095 [Pseudomonadota bacterium]
MRTYTHRQFVWAVNLSALLGWACLALPASFIGTFVWGLLLWAAIIGLPIAFLCCWVIGAPVLHYIMRDSITWFAAIAWGAAIGGLISLAVFVITIIVGITMYMGGEFHAETGGLDVVKFVDGVLSAKLWLQILKLNLLWLGLAIFIAITLRAIIGPGTKNSA